MKYGFVIEATISLNCDVEADSLVEAIEKAKSLPTKSLCHQCAHGDPRTWNTSGEIDADPPACKLIAVYRDGEYLGDFRLGNAQAMWRNT